MSRAVRIALYVAPPIFGGVATWARNYLRYLDHSRFSVDFLVQEDLPDAVRIEVESAGGYVRRLPRMKFLPQFIWHAWKTFRSGGYDVVHANHNLLNVFILFPAFLAHVPMRISHAHSISDRRDLVRHLIKMCLRPFSRLFVTRMLACSQSAAEFQFGKKAVERGLVTIVHNAIEPKRFAYSARDRVELRASLGLDDEAFVIGHIGRMAPPKNQRFLIDLVAEVRKTRPETVLVFVGDGPDRPALDACAASRLPPEAVRFVGHVYDANRYYSAFDVFCFPSLYEGLGLVLVEAQANGLPCVASTGVPREADVTRTVQYHRLDVAVWARSVLELPPRRTAVQLPPEYSLDDEVHELERVYEG